MSAESSSDDHADQQATDALYVCPRESQPISRALHLARMANLYRDCGGCSRREQSPGFSPKKAKALEEAWRSQEQASTLFHAEGLSGIYLNEIGPDEARRIGQGFGAHQAADQDHDQPVILACDGRPWTVELSAAVGAGLRWAGCRVIDIGAATSARVAMAINRFSASGAALVGNATGQPRHIGVSLFGFNAEPLSSPGELDSVQRLFHSPAPRPPRPYGPLERTSLTSDYFAPLVDFYHAMRPLRVIVDTTSVAVAQCLAQLIGTVSVQVDFMAKGSDLAPLGERVRQSNAHFGAWIDGDGERCQLVDESGIEVGSDQILLMLARETLAQSLPASFVVAGLMPTVVERLRRMHAGVMIAGASRAAMHRAMQEHRPTLAGDAEGRLWYPEAGNSADALRTFTLVLTLLSRSDRALSQLAQSAIL